MPRSNKYICIHGHFYQPPRENAWLEFVELQDSAQPFHDWNERINFECYAPNTAARILDHDGYITKISNNYIYLNFNFGPTLLSWMELADPETHAGIVKADKISLEKFNGHGSAIAQAYNHMIQPLANPRDQETQVIWGIRDFEYRFGRKPEGMWLPETAANVDSLEVMARHGIKYTILAPRQAKAFRKIGEKQWKEVSKHGFDTRRPYLAKLPSGRKIALFVYDGNTAQGVAFEGLLNNGKNFAKRFLDVFDDNDVPQLSHIATDGESYGHHHRHGEMALADCLNHIRKNNLATLTNYGEYLELFPPEYELQIHDNSSWSCVHGVERWRSNCGCNSGGHNWTQAWRGPLRETLDWLRDQLIPVYEQQAEKLLKDPWLARNAYIDVLLNRGDESVEAFIKTQAIKKPTKKQKTQILRLMEMQRNAMLMYSSCGWFFDEISGLETNQILQYACRAIYYANQVGGVELEKEFIDRLAKAPSNVYGNGAHSYTHHVLPTRVDLVRAAMHYAVSSLFEKYPEQLNLFNYIASSEQFDRIEAGNQILSLGRTVMKSRVTYSEKHFTFAVLYLGQQNIIGSISIDMTAKRYEEMSEKIKNAFRKTHVGEVISLMQDYFGSEKYSFQHLFRDEKRKILKRITRRNLKQAETAFRDIYNDNYQLMTSSLQSNIPIPKAYNNIVQFMVNADLHQFFTRDILNITELKRLAKELEKWDIQLGNEKSFVFAAGERIFYEIRQIIYAGGSIEQMESLTAILETLDEMGFEPDIWKSQNLYFSEARAYRKGQKTFSDEPWKAAFIRLGELLKVRGVKV